MKASLSQILLDGILFYNGYKSHIFGVTGDDWCKVDPYLQQLINQKDIEYIHSTNESSGCYSACIWGDYTGKTGIVFTTSGPGVSMTPAGILWALREEKPLVCICGQSEYLDQYSFQYIDMNMMKAITKKTLLISPESNPYEVLYEAFYNVRYNEENPNFGPVVIFVQASSWDILYDIENYRPIVKPLDTRFNQDIYDKIRNIFYTGEKIIIRLGDRLDEYWTRQLYELLKGYPNIRFQTEFQSKNRLVPEWIGLEGNLGYPQVNQEIGMTDYLLSIGTGIGYGYVTVPRYDVSSIREIYHVYDDGYAERYSENSIFMNVNQFVEILIQDLKSQSLPIKTSWQPYIPRLVEVQRQYLEMYKSQNQYRTSPNIIAHILYQLYNLYPNTYEDYQIRDKTLMMVFDIGLFANVAYQLTRIPYRQQIMGGNFAPIGCAPALAAGSVYTRQYKKYIVCQGEGGFFNAMNYIIDFKLALHKTQSSGIFILIADEHYSNVTLEELRKNGITTSITSTSDFLNVISLKSILANIADYFYSYTNPNTNSFVSTFQNWYSNTPIGLTILFFHVYNFGNYITQSDL